MYGQEPGSISLSLYELVAAITMLLNYEVINLYLFLSLSLSSVLLVIGFDLDPNYSIFFYIIFALFTY